MSIIHKDPLVQSVGEEIANELAGMERFFKPGVKLTFVARRPGFPDQDMLITDDEMSEIAAAIQRAAQRRKDAEP